MKEKIYLASKESRRVSIIFIVVLFIVFVITTFYTDFNPVSAVLAQGEFWDFIVTDFFPPQMNRWEALFLAVLQTFFMALSACGIASVIALGLSILGTKTIVRSTVVNNMVRGFASILRNIPSLVWAFILVAAFGIGTAVGVMALVLGNIGTLTRFFIETFDETSDEVMEAPLSAGSSMPPIVFQVIIPSAVPGLISWILYCVELNIRSSTILGMVGAGGVGLLMMSYIKQYNYSAASATILTVAIIIIGVNLITEYLRKLILK